MAVVILAVIVVVVTASAVGMIVGVVVPSNSGFLYLV